MTRQTLPPPPPGWDRLSVSRVRGLAYGGALGTTARGTRVRTWYLHSAERIKRVTLDFNRVKRTGISGQFTLTY